MKSTKAGSLDSSVWSKMCSWSSKACGGQILRWWQTFDRWCQGRWWRTFDMWCQGRWWFGTASSWTVKLPRPMAVWDAPSTSRLSSIRLVKATHVISCEGVRSCVHMLPEGCCARHLLGCQVMHMLLVDATHGVSYRGMQSCIFPMDAMHFVPWGVMSVLSRFYTQCLLRGIKSYPLLMDHRCCDIY
jgi:hypothetical protein